MALDHFKKKQSDSKVKIKGPHFKQKNKIKSHSPIDKNQINNMDKQEQEAPSLKEESPLQQNKQTHNQIEEIDSTTSKLDDLESETNLEENKKENIVTAKIKEKQLKEKTSIGEERIQTEAIEEEKSKNQANSTVSHNNQLQVTDKFETDNFQMNSIKENCSNLKSSLKQVAVQTQKMADNLDELIKNTEELESDINISDFESQVQASDEEKSKKDDLDLNLNQGLLDKLSIVIILHVLFQRFFVDEQDE